MTQAQQALQAPALTSSAVDAQFFTRATVYRFADGSVLTQNMYGPSYAT